MGAPWRDTCGRQHWYAGKAGFGIATVGSLDGGTQFLSPEVLVFMVNSKIEMMVRL
jgi:hypothetical protein